MAPSGASDGAFAAPLKSKAAPPTPFSPRPPTLPRFAAFIDPCDPVQDFEQMNETGARGVIAVDKMGGKVLFLDPDTHATTHVLDDFEPLPHELLVAPQSLTAYVPIYGDGIHGRNP